MLERVRRRRRRIGQSSMDFVQASSQPSPVAIERSTAEPGVPAPSIPGHDPVMDGEAQHGQSLVFRRDRWQALEVVPKVVAKEPDETAQKPRRVGAETKQT